MRPLIYKTLGFYKYDVFANGKRAIGAHNDCAGMNGVDTGKAPASWAV